MSVHSESQIISSLKSEYDEGAKYNDIRTSIHGDCPIEIRGFFGSLNVVYLTNDHSITYESPACIAAPFVTMVAKDAISIGMKGNGDHNVPVRVYAPKVLSITTKHLSIGNLMLGKTENGFISCKKLTLAKSTDTDPPHFETVKSWLINDDVEIETIRL